MLPAIFGAAARYGIPALGSALGSMLPDLIHAFQGGGDPAAAQQALQPHYETMIKLGLSPDEAKQALASELKDAADPKDHPVIDGLISAVGAVGGGMLAHRFVAPKFAFPATTSAKARQAATIQTGGPSTAPANKTIVDEVHASGGANKQGSPQMQTKVHAPSSAYPQSQRDELGVQMETPTEQVRMSQQRMMNEMQNDPMATTQPELFGTPRDPAQTTINTPLNLDPSLGETQSLSETPTGAFPPVDPRLATTVRRRPMMPGG